MFTPIKKLFAKRNQDLKPGMKRFKTPTVIQMEAVECGAAALTIIMGFYRKFVPLEEVRGACGVSRDGSKASNVLRAARSYGFVAKGFKKTPQKLLDMSMPLIVFWNFNHFVVVEGFSRDRKFVYLNDPSNGRRKVTWDEFDQSFTGVALAIEPGPEFQPSGKPRNVISALVRRMKGAEMALLYVTLCALALVVPGVLIPIFGKIFVDQVLVNDFSHWLWPLLFGMTLTAMLRGLFTYLQQIYLLRLEAKLALSTSSQFFWHVLRLPMEFFSQRFAGDISNRVSINDKVARLMSGELATHVLNFMLIIFYAGLMFSYNGLLTGIGIVMASLNVAVLILISRKRKDANERLLKDRGKLMGTAAAGLMRIETIKSTGSESEFFSQWAGYQAKAMNGEQELAVTSQTLNTIPPFLTSINTAIILTIGSLKVMDGSMTMGMLVAFQSLMSSFFEPVNKLVALGTRLQEIEGDLNRLDDVLKHQQDALFLNEATHFHEEQDPPPPPKLKGHLEIKNVNFGYSQLEAPLIEDFNLSLKPGMRVALVGGSGSGKSTLSKLVCGLYQPWSGQILFDNVPRLTLPRYTLTNSFAFVDQDIFLFEGTLRENLTLWDTTIPETDLIRAAKDAAIHNEISARSNGYNSLVEEGGRNFSGGQRQRLEIARALVGNPSLLVLDEATSALDPIIEKVIDDNLRRRGCTCLIVAHRLSTIRDCDEIIVLDHGKVVQRGTHEEMKDIDGPYTNLILSH